MGSNYIHKCRKYLFFTMDEAKQLLLTAVVAGFVLSFDKWGGDAVDVAVGLQNLILGVIFVLIAMFVHVMAQKLTAIWKDYELEFMYWKLGMMVGVLVTFVTNGLIPLFFTGAIRAKSITTARVGKYQPRWKVWEMGIVSVAGPLSNLVLILLAKPFFEFTGSDTVFYFITANLLVMIYSMLPLPLFHGVKVIESGRTAYDFSGGTIGFNVFFANRGLYLFFFTLILVYSLLIVLAGIFSLILAALIALIIGAVWYYTLQVE